MPISKTEGRKMSDVVEAIFHESFNYEVVQLNNGDVVLPIYSNVCGKIALFVSAGIYKILDAGDVINGTSNVAVILSHKATQIAGTADVANLLPKCVILSRGPACVNLGELDFGAAVQATVLAALLAKNIVTVRESGSLYANF